MADLAPIVRPALPPPTGIYRRPRKEEKSKVNEIPTLEIEASGIKLLTWNYNYSSTFVSVYAQRDHKVIEEDYDKARVRNPENPEDDSQYLDVDVPRKHKINRQEKTKRNHTVEYPELEEADHIEILERNLKRKIER